MKIVLIILMSASLATAFSEEKDKKLSKECLKKSKSASCLELGTNYAADSENDFRLAISFLNKGCVLKNKESCAKLKEVQSDLELEYGKCTSGSEYTSCEKFRNNCEKYKDSIACYAVGTHWFKQSDVFMTEEYLKKSCLYGDKDVCKNLSKIMTTVRKNKEIVEAQDEQRAYNDSLLEKQRELVEKQEEANRWQQRANALNGAAKMFGSGNNQEPKRTINCDTTSFNIYDQTQYRTNCREK